MSVDPVHERFTCEHDAAEAFTFVGTDGAVVSPGAHATVTLTRLESRVTVVFAYDATSGRQLWVQRYDGGAGGQDGASAIAVSADGHKIYTANGPSGDVSVVDIATGTVDRRIAVGKSPWGVILAPRQ